MTHYDRPDPLRRGFGGPDTAGATGDAGAAGDPEEIVVEIQETRVELGATIDAIQDRLNPEYLKEQAKDVIHDAAEEAKGVVREAGGQAKEFVRDATVGTAEEAVSGVARTARGVGTTMLDTIRQNPIPAALVGIGLGWLFFKNQGGSNQQNRSFGYTGIPGGSYGYAGNTGRSSGDQAGWQGSGNFEGRQRYGWETGTGTATTTGRGSTQGSNGSGQVFDRVQDAAGQMTDRVQGAAGQMTDRVQGAAGQVADQVQETAGRFVGSAQQTTQQMTSSVQSQFQQMLRETPLALGGLALATGLAVGLAIPETEQENQLLGEARDSFVQQVKETAQDTQQKLQQVAQEAGKAAQEEAKEQQLTS